MPKTVSAQDALALWKEQDLQPLEPFTRSNDPWPSKCLRCGSLVAPRYNDVRRGKGRCGKTCKSRSIASALSISDPVARELMIRGGWVPVPGEPYEGANAPWTCTCLTCGVRRRKRLSHVKNGHVRCDRCAGEEVVTSEVALVLFRRYGLEPEPDQVFPGSQAPWLCTCSNCDTSITTVTYSKLKYREGYVGCPGCGSRRGMDLTRAGYLYLVEHKGLQALKIGIAGGALRIKQHQTSGWALVQTWPFAIGYEAYRVEQSVLQWWRELGLGPAVTREVMRYGYTETVSSRSMTASAVLAAVAHLRRGAGVPRVLGEFRDLEQ